MGKRTSVVVTCDGVKDGVVCGKPVEFKQLAACVEAEKLERRGVGWQDRLYFCSKECAQPAAHAHHAQQEDLAKCIREGELYGD